MERGGREGQYGVFSIYVHRMHKCGSERLTRQINHETVQSTYTSLYPIIYSVITGPYHKEKPPKTAAIHQCFLPFNSATKQKYTNNNRVQCVQSTVQ